LLHLGDRIIIFLELNRYLDIYFSILEYLNKEGEGKDRVWLQKIFSQLVEPVRTVQEQIQVNGFGFIINNQPDACVCSLVIAVILSNDFLHFHHICF
jgi:hypothetical protein